MMFMKFIFQDHLIRKKEPIAANSIGSSIHVILNYKLPAGYEKFHISSRFSCVF